MRKIQKTYKFELKPTKEQCILLNKHFGATRYVYNHFLNERKEQYQANKKSDNYVTVGHSRQNPAASEMLPEAGLEPTRELPKGF